MRKLHRYLLSGLVLVLVWPGAVRGQMQTHGQVWLPLDRPEEGEFVLDRAGLLSQPQQQHIRQTANALLADTAIPLIVVTIDSKLALGGGQLPVETFARLLYDQWGIGQADIDGRPWNRGILLLVVRDDREARIELGSGFGRDLDDQAQQIMDGQILPHFRRGEYELGILAGVEGLDRMARGLGVSWRASARAQARWWHGLILAGGIGLMVFTAVSLHRSGRHGWAAVMWIALFGLLVMILREAWRHRGRGGGFGGGSFGGGRSGGGGATGRW